MRIATVFLTLAAFCASNAVAFLHIPASHAHQVTSRFAATPSTQKSQPLRDVMVHMTREETMEHAGTIFSAIDTDRSGTIEENELGALLQRLKVGNSSQPEYVRQTFRLLDTNGDGKISFDEFREWFAALVVPQGGMTRSRGGGGSLSAFFRAAEA